MASAVLLTPPAFAGEYRYVACRDAAGQNLPAGSWTRESRGIAIGEDKCATDGFFYAVLGPGQTGISDWSGVRIDMPEGLRAMSLRADRWARSDAGDTDDFNASPAFTARWGATARWFDTGTQAVETCDLSLNCRSLYWPGFPTTSPADVTYTFPGGAGFIGFAVACAQHGPAGGACRTTAGGRAHMRLSGLDLLVRDDAAPTVGDLSGSLLQAEARAGMQTLSFPAGDVGSGIFEGLLSIDGTQVVRVMPDATPTCASGSGSLPGPDRTFARLQPCRASAVVEFSLDTTKLTDGIHRVTAVVRDASGNASAAVSRDVVIDNRSAVVTPPGPTPLPSGPNGSGGDPSTGRLALTGEPRTIRAPHGARRTIKGKLVDAAGRPIVGAMIDVTEQLDVPAAPWTSAGTAQTDGRGDYRFAPRTTASRRLRFTFSPMTGGGAITAKREVLVSVRAGLTIKAAATTVPRRGLIALSGQVKLDALPRKGTYVEIQYLQKKVWRTIASRKTTANGTWSYHHRLSDFANVVLPFRARLRPASDLPSAEATSRRLDVRVR